MKEVLSLGWEVKDNALVKEFRFRDFVEALSFVIKVGFLAEKSSHHPDILIKYNRVILSLTTHDEGGITDKDYKLARMIESM